MEDEINSLAFQAGTMLVGVGLGITVYSLNNEEKSKEDLEKNVAVGAAVATAGWCVQLAKVAKGRISAMDID